MKRIIGLLLLLTMCVSFCACKGSDNNSSSTTDWRNDDNSSEAYAEETEKIQSLVGVWRCYITTDLYVEYMFAEDGSFSVDMIGKGNFDRDWGTGYYTIEGDSITITLVDGDHPGDIQSFKYAVEGDTLAIYYDDHGETKRRDFKKYE